jgi:1-pyrroline-5-carboxylate dehydrogenase
MHESADVDNFVTQTIRGAFEYSGQKCSAVSRVYIPKSKWNDVRERLVSVTRQLKVGQPNDPTSFTSCVIDKTSFEKINGYLDRAKKDNNVEILVGGNSNRSKGYFIEPTIILSKNPKSETMVEEIFGPVLTVYVYEDSWENVLHLVDESSPYGLTGSIFAKDRDVITKAHDILRHSSGNFYINDKSTGAVVGQQAFGGARLSGTNDKAGSETLLWRFTSGRSIKENFIPISDWQYPSVDVQ